MKKTQYFFACSAGALVYCIERDQEAVEGKSFRFYNNDDSFFHHPNVLISAGHQYKNEGLREQWKIDDSALVLGDSGGFQIATGVIDVNKIDRQELRERIFKWLESNTDIAMNIDIPPFVSGFSGTVSESLFDECLDLSVENFRYFYENQSGKTKFLNVLQGRTTAQMERWYSKIKDFEFQGWAVGGATNVKHLLPGIKFLLDKGELGKPESEYLHLLGVSSNEAAIYLLYMQKLMNKLNIDIQITFDSSSPAMSAANGGYFLMPKPTANTVVRFTSRADYSEKEDLRLPCDCPVCSEITLKDIIEFKSRNYSILTLHNLYQFIDFHRKIDRILDFDDWEVFKSAFGTRIMRNLKALHAIFVEDRYDSNYLYTHFKSVEPNFVEGPDQLNDFFS